MEKNCLYCGTHFTTNRNNKKFCSDTCKQMAYFKRNGLVLSGKTETPSVKYNLLPVMAEQKSNSIPEATIKQAAGEQVIIKAEEKKEQSVKFASETPNVKGVKREENTNVKFVSTENNNKENIQSILVSYKLDMEKELEKAIEKIKTEFAVKYDKLIQHLSKVESLNANDVNQTPINYCKPSETINVKCASEILKENCQTENTPTHQESEAENSHQVKIIELKDVGQNTSEEELSEHKENETMLFMLENEHLESEEPFKEEEEESDEVLSEETKREQIKQNIEEENETEENQRLIEETEKQLALLKIEVQNKKQQQHQKIKVEKEIESEYTWVKSTFIKRIEKKYIETDKVYIFRHQSKFWTADEMISANWINIRLLCIVESMIKLSNYNKIDKHTILCLSDAINHLYKSNAYNSLPKNYPHRELINELLIKLSALANNTFVEKPKFVLSVELKTKLIAIRSQMIKYTEAIKFSEMDFTEKNWLSDEKTEEEKPRKKKDWQYKFEAYKREQQLNAA